MIEDDVVHTISEIRDMLENLSQDVDSALRLVRNLEQCNCPKCVQVTVSTKCLRCIGTGKVALLGKINEKAVAYTIEDCATCGGTGNVAEYKLNIYRDLDTRPVDSTD